MTSAHCAKHGGQRSTVVGESVKVSQIRQFAEDNPVIGGQGFNSVYLHGDKSQSQLVKWGVLYKAL